MLMARDSVLTDGSERSMQQETDRLADSSKILADLPKPRWAMLLILPTSLIIGIFYSPWEGDRWVLEWIGFSLLLYAIPAWAGAILSSGYLKLMGANAYFYRSALMALAMLVIVGIMLVLGTALSILDLVTFPEWYLFSYSATAMVLHLFHLVTATRRWVLALPATLAQPLLGMLPFLYLYYNEFDTGDVQFRPIVLMVIFLGTFIGVGHMAMHFGTRPMSENYGINGTDVFRAFLEHWVQGGDAGREEIEGFFRVFS
ncbi:MAG: DUF2070 family protein, partial [Thermoplasmata archaeon]|nr:DUF2070 family protein [Thermoplasmata archaeon]